jgi:acetyl-CoA synthetase
MVIPLPGATALKPGSATTPFFGVRPVVLDDKGNEIEATACGGILAIADSWPGQMRTI